MNPSLQNPLTLVARVLLALMFLLGGYGKLGAGFAGTVGYIGSVGLPAASVLAALAAAVELVGAVLLIIGYQTRWAALALALFTLAANVFFHNYWAMPADKQMVNQLMFLKNLAVAGGMLALVAWGAGAWSLDAKRRAG